MKDTSVMETPVSRGDGLIRAAVFGLMLTMSMSSWAECRTDALPQSTPTSRFNLEGEALTDRHTSLMWMRCAVGQLWNGHTCAGTAEKVTWERAREVVEKINEREFAGHRDWRLPVVPELASIVELQCFHPRMNVDVFNAAPSMLFWSSMEKMGAPAFAYTLDFGGGEAVPTRKMEKGAVRLVRGGPWWQPPKMTQR